MQGYVGECQNPNVQHTVRTRDLASMESGRIRLKGRTDRCLNIGGNLILADEIEEILQTHPLVRAVKVRAEIHHYWGELPVACVVARRGAHDELAADLRQLVTEQIGAFCGCLKIQFARSLRDRSKCYALLSSGT